MRKRACLILLGCIALSVTFAAELPEGWQRRFDYVFMEALRMRNQGRYAEAYELYRHALAIRPDAPEALFDMALFCNYLGTREEAGRYYERAVELAPQNNWYRQTLAGFYRSSGQLNKAVEVYEALAANNPEKSGVYYELLELYNQLQDYRKGIQALDQIERLEGKSEQASMEKFRLYLRLEDRDKAFAEMDALAREYPNDLRYRVILGDLYLDNDEPDKALTVYQSVLDEEPQNVLAQLSMATYYEKTGQSERSRQALETLLLNPAVDTPTRVGVMRRIVYDEEMAQTDSTRILNLFDQVLALPQDGADMALLCTQYKLHKKMPADDVARSLQRVVELDPGNTGARLQLLQYAFDRKDLTEVIRLCQQAIDYAPDELPFYYYQGMAWYQSGQEEKALEIFLKGLSMPVLENDRELTSNLYGASGDIYYNNLHQTDRAFEMYDSALVYKPDNVTVLNNYAYYLSLERRDLDRAEEMSFRTVKADPKSYNELDTYAWILFLKGKTTEARLYIDESLKNGGGEHSGIVEHAGDIYYKCGEMDRALEFWQKADAMGSDSKTLKRKIKQKKYIE